MIVFAMQLDTQRFAQLIVNCLAVGGGFLVGWMLFAGLAKAFDRFVIHRKSPMGLHRVVRNTGAIAVAVLVAIIVFGHGQGWTLFGGGGLGAENAGAEKTGPKVDKATSSETKSTPIAARDVGPIDERIKVTMLGGDDVKDARFYLIGSDTTPRTFAEATTAIAAKRDALKGQRIAVEIHFSVTNTLPQDHPAVTRLVRWARTDAGLSVTFPADGR